MYEAYTLRNQAILAEINTGLRLSRGLEVRSPNQWADHHYNTRFYPVGSYYSTVLARELHIGLKEFEYSSADTRALFDLAVARVVYCRFPALGDEVTAFVGLLNKQGNNIGVIIEDFSRGGRDPVYEMTNHESDQFEAWELPEELRQFGSRKKPLTDHDLARAFFLVNGQRKLGDLKKLLTELVPKEVNQDFPIDDLVSSEAQEKYTLKIDYDI
jgi:hypothetical protein